MNSCWIAAVFYFYFYGKSWQENTHTHTRTSVHTPMVNGQCPGLAFLSRTAECTSRFSRLCASSRRAASHCLNQVFSRFISPSCLNAQVSTSKDLPCYPFKGREKKTHFYFYFSFTLNYFVCAATSVFRKRKKPANMLDCSDNTLLASCPGQQGLC